MFEERLNPGDERNYQGDDGERNDKENEGNSGIVEQRETH